MRNRFLELDEYQCSPATRRRKGSNGAASGTAIAQSLSWAAPFSASSRALVILIENGGIDLGIPELVDKLLDALPGSSLIPDSWKDKLVSHLREKLKTATDNLIETVELSANRYSAAKPEFYGSVTILRNGTATYQALKDKLIALSKEGMIIDVMILTHGARENIVTLDGYINAQNIRDIKAANGGPLRIRSVYMMNCWGSSLNQAWIDIGARVSSGSRDINYLPEPTTFFFFRNWKKGDTFATAVNSAFLSTIKLMNDTVRTFIRAIPIPGTGYLADQVDFAKMGFVGDSTPVILGDQSVTINSDSISFSQSVSTGMAVTLVPVDSLRAISSAQSTMTVSDEGINLIKQFEGFRSKMYNDPVGHCTIGYGTLIHSGNCDGRDSEKPYADGVTEEKATKLLADKAAEFQKVINDNVKVSLNQNQNDALVSFVYNIGPTAFQKSTLLKVLNKGEYGSVPSELKRWNKGRDEKGNLIELPGLVKRREAEAALFQRAVTSTAKSLSRGSWPIRGSYSFQSDLSSAMSQYSMQMNPVLIGGIAVADAIQIGLAGVAIIQSQVAASQGSFTLSYDKAQRMLTSDARAAMPGAQTAKKTYSRQVFYIGASGFANADVIIEWEGNPYGEISTPIIRRNLSNSTEWSKSSCNITITKVDRIPLPGTDPRTWPIYYSYEGTYDIPANGYFEFSGEFEINAFGGLKFKRHEVVSRSFADWAIGGKPEDYVQKGKDVIVAVPDVPQEQINYLKSKLP